MKNARHSRAFDYFQAALLERCQGCVVIRFVLDLADQFAVQDLVVGIQHHHGTSAETLEGAVFHRHAVFLQELGNAEG